MTDRLIKPQRVASRLDCGITQAKFKMKNDLGGWYEPGIGWRCTERALNAFIASRAKGAQCQASYPSSSVPPKAELTGTATSEHQTDDAISEPSTSEPMEAVKASVRRSAPTGTSKRAQQLASWIESDPRGRSNRRLPHSRRNKSSPS